MTCASGDCICRVRGWMLCLGLTHGLAGSIHFSIKSSEGGQLVRAARQADVQLIVCWHLIVSPLQVLLIL